MSSSKTYRIRTDNGIRLVESTGIEEHMLAKGVILTEKVYYDHMTGRVDMYKLMAKQGDKQAQTVLKNLIIANPELFI